MAKRILFVVLTALLAGFSQAHASQSDVRPDVSVAQAWQQLTLSDVEAAHELLIADHPAAAPEVEDTVFASRLTAAYEVARLRAGEVSSYSGYLATLQGLATAVGDKHIRSRPLALPVSVDWAGLLIARQGSAWMVAVEDAAQQGPSLIGARLLSCDGTSVDQLAQDRLGGFRAFWAIEAQRISAAPWLLVDDGNPFLKRPKSCSFEQNGNRRELTLNWRPTRRQDLIGRLPEAVRRGAPGFGVRQVGDGYWISLQSLNDNAGPVVEQVVAQADAIRRAPFVVLDLRGNGGGNSAYGAQIAEALLGTTPGPAAEPSAGPRCTVVWRATTRNLEQVRFYEERQRREFGEEAAEDLRLVREAGVAAQAANRSFTGPTSCDSLRGRGQISEPARDPVRFPQKVAVLTDYVCFSSCLLVTDLFRKRGALHIGQETDAATRYFEVRDDVMPSGLSTFSTMQALSNGSEPNVGPFAPDRVFDGDISDTAAIERWVLPMLN